jgi:hypothetical protein
VSSHTHFNNVPKVRVGVLDDIKPTGHMLHGRDGGSAALHHGLLLQELGDGVQLGRLTAFATAVTAGLVPIPTPRLFMHAPRVDNVVSRGRGVLQKSHVLRDVLDEAAQGQSTSRDTAWGARMLVRMSGKREKGAPRQTDCPAEGTAAKLP